MAIANLISNKKKKPPKYRKLDETKNKNVTPQKITRLLTIFAEHGRYNGSYTMMAKPMKILELHYPMIQFLIMNNRA